MLPIRIAGVHGTDAVPHGVILAFDDVRTMDAGAPGRGAFGGPRIS